MLGWFNRRRARREPVSRESVVSKRPKLSSVEVLKQEKVRWALNQPSGTVVKPCMAGLPFEDDEVGLLDDNGCFDLWVKAGNWEIGLPVPYRRCCPLWVEVKAVYDSQAAGRVQKAIDDLNTMYPTGPAQAGTERSGSDDEAVWVDAYIERAADRLQPVETTDGVIVGYQEDLDGEEISDAQRRQ